MPRKNRRTEPEPAAIRADEILPLVVLKQRFGWGDCSVSQAQKAGLRMLTFGSKKYVLGAELIRFLQAQNQEAPS
jgi:hypothetical protein